MGQYGTILYGTSFYSSSHKVKCFSCEDIIYYIGNKMEWGSKPSFLASNELIDLFTCKLKQVAYNKNFIVCGLPVITRQLSDAYEHIKTLPYVTYCIQQRTSSGQLIGITIVRPNSSDAVSPTRDIDKGEVVFNVKPSLHPDIYDLYCRDDNDCEKERFYGTAMIPSYKSSVFMNGLFRNIKENRNLDLLEESDDEEEFQNNREDKFVDLGKSLYMKCVFNKKFDKWQPIKVIEKVELLTQKQIRLFEQK